jgi:hypothetical protein
VQLRTRRVALLAVSLALAGCGLGPGEELGGGVRLSVTRDFGHERLLSAERAEVRESDTAMRLLQSEADVETEYGGGFVQSVDGLEGEGPGGSRDWFYFVNGLEADVGAADFPLSPGDVVQWDYRDWEAAMRVPAIVGAYPEPFVHGSMGERLPTRVECEEAVEDACEEVTGSLGDAGVTASEAPLGAPASGEVLRVVVATWPVARDVPALQTIEAGPEASGVFARFSPDGEELALLGEDGEEAATAPAGSGLVAATELPEGHVVWAVTGADQSGVEAAARALDERALSDAFAVVATPDGTVSLPIVDSPPEAGS